MSVLTHTPVPASPPPAPPPPDRTNSWSVGRLVALVLGGYLLLGAASLLATAAWLSHVDDDRRDGGYLTTDETSVSTDSHALVVEDIDLNGLSGDWVLGRARLRAASADPQTSVFVGIAREDDADAYLRGTAYATVSDIDDDEATYVEHSGAAPSTTPAAADIWVAQASGPGTQELTWTPRSGDWTAIIMNADASSGVDVTTDVGATVPVFEWVVGALWLTGAALGLPGAVLVIGALVRRTRA